jgi:hypothetical protein
MANSGLDAIIPLVVRALNVVSRELVGFIPAVYRDADGSRAALNQSLVVPIAAAATLADNTPGVTPPNTGDETVTNVTMTVSKSKHAPIRFNGEETLGLSNAGAYERLFQSRAEEALRALVNAVEADLYAAAYKGASRAYGTAGTTPFATAADMTDLAEVALILDDNGCPIGERQIVLSNAAMSKLRGKQSGLFKVNEAGSDQMLREGMISKLEGFAVRQSGQVSTHTKGTGSGYLADLLAGYAIGDSALHVDTGTGAILAGDVVTFAWDANKYVIGTGFAGDGDGDIALNAPGLRAALANDVEMTIGNSFKANVAFDRRAVVLLSRLPALPKGGDSAIDRTTITDPLTGLVFELAEYPGYRLKQYQIGLAWGTKAVKPAHIANLLG